MAGETVLTIVGNLTADPELRTTGGGATVASFTIASTPRNWNRQANQFEDGQALFMRCSAWGDMAGHCIQSLHKGMRVIATGRLKQHSYQTQDGSQRTVIDMTIDEIGPSLRYATAQVTRVQCVLSSWSRPFRRWPVLLVVGYCIGYCMRAWVLRQDSPSKRIIRPWWTVRSMIAAAMLGSPKILPHPLNSMLVV